MGISNNTYKALGFVEEIKFFGPICFLIVRELNSRNGYGKKYQFIVKDPEHLKVVKQISRESYIQIEGVYEEEQKSGVPSLLCSSFVIKEPSAKVWGPSLSKKLDKISYEFDVLQYRRPEFYDVLRVRSLVYEGLRDYMRQCDALEITTPKLINQFTEGGADLFHIPYYNDSILYLSQSPQLYKQAAVCMGNRLVYEIGPIYRAEKFKTTRHLNETVCWDLQMAVSNMEELIFLIRDALIYTSIKVNAQYSYIKALSKEDFLVISYEQALKKLKLEQSEDFNIDAEKKLVQLLGVSYVFVTHYPSQLKPFYIRGNLNFDLIGVNGEISSGGLREVNQASLIDQLKSRDIDIQALSWYLKMFSVGTPSMGGAGLGIDRLITSWLNLSNIKYTSLFSEGTSN